MLWLLENTKDLAGEPNLCLSTIDTWLIKKLTGEVLTDSTNASRTMLMDISKLEWSDKMLDEYGLKKDWLPEIRKQSSDNFGKVECEGLSMLKDVVIGGVLGDQQAACLGHVLREG